MATNGDRKSTGSNFGCTFCCEFIPHSFSQSSSDGTVTSTFVPQSGTTAGQVGMFRAGTVVVWGDNGSGQTNVPASLTDIIAIAAGSDWAHLNFCAGLLSGSH